MGVGVGLDKYERRLFDQLMKYSEVAPYLYMFIKTPGAHASAWEKVHVLYLYGTWYGTFVSESTSSLPTLP